MPKIVVKTIVIETTNAPAAQNAGLPRAASHTKTGNSQVIGNSVSQSQRGSEMIRPVINARATSASVLSMTSLRGDGRRTTAAIPITSGATAMMPTKSDANQCCQVVNIGADGPRINQYVTAPPNPDTVVAANAAANRPTTWRTRTRLKPSPK